MALIRDVRMRYIKSNKTRLIQFLTNHWIWTIQGDARKNDVLKNNNLLLNKNLRKKYDLDFFDKVESFWYMNAHSSKI